jgi:uncharacterized protein YjiK
MKALTVLAVLIIMILSCHFKENNKSNESRQEPASDSGASEEKNSSFKYELSKPQKKWVLPDELKEISGNAWIDNDHLLVIEDLHPNLYLLSLDKDLGVIEKTIPFETTGNKKFDIEDVTIAGNDVYALWSHGVIFKIEDWQNKPRTKEIPTFLDKKNNTEGICYDPVTHDLLIACKNESGLEDEKKSTRAIFELDMQTGKLKKDPFILIQKKDFKEANGDKLDFNPSAIAVHPVTHDIYIISTKGTKALARYNHNGQFLSVQMIDEEIMPQPEGICFSPDGILFISTEGKHGVPARLYQFNYSHS